MPNVEGFYYLATPYRKYRYGRARAHAEACKIAGKLMEQGLPVVSPIAHSHPIAMHSPQLDARCHETWMRLDRPIMEAAVGLIVARMEGWDESQGIEEEMEYFFEAGKITWHLTEDDMSGNKYESFVKDVLDSTRHRVGFSKMPTLASYNEADARKDWEDAARMHIASLERLVASKK